jgi:thioredoxin reductase (NADPH)
MNAISDQHFELIIIGAGPAGLSAALYASREDIKTLVLDKGVVGGMAAITARIDNYPGFDRGIGGLELADHLADHAKRFGADIQTGIEVTGLHHQDGRVHLDTSAGPLAADAIILATGSTYKHLGVPGENEFTGRGVHFCATCDAPLYRGKNILVAGGGNSAIQESLFIAKFASEVTLLVRRSELDGTAVLREELEALPNVSYRFDTEVTAINSLGSKFTGVKVRDRSGSHDLPADALFVFIGLVANTKAFTGTVKLDQQGYIVTTPRFATSVTGVFAAGDVRSGSTWQIATAAGEGVAAAISVREHLMALRHRARHHAAHR